MPKVLGSLLFMWETLLSLQYPAPRFSLAQLLETFGEQTNRWELLFSLCIIK